ncbi:unnamed protein product, partial [Urochloa humidicola]
HPHHVFTSTVPTSAAVLAAPLLPRAPPLLAHRRPTLLPRPSPALVLPLLHTPRPPRDRALPQPPSLLRPPAVALPYPPPKRSGATWLPAPGGSPTPPQRMELFDGMVQPIFRSTGSSRCGNSPSEEAC